MDIKEIIARRARRTYGDKAIKLRQELLVLDTILQRNVIRIGESKKPEDIKTLEESRKAVENVASELVEITFEPKKSTGDLINEAKQILGCLTSGDACVFKRLSQIGLAPVCERCGGTGKYSYNQVDGDTCYGCHGRGWLIPKINQKLVDDLKIKERDGIVRKLLNDIERRQQENAWLREHGASKLLSKWKSSEISSYYDWRHLNPKFPDFVPEYVRIAEINAEMAKAYELALDAELNSIKAKHGKMVYTRAQLIADLKHADTMLDAALFLWSEYVEEHQPEKVN